MIFRTEKFSSFLQKVSCWIFTHLCWILLLPQLINGQTISDTLLINQLLEEAKSLQTTDPYIAKKKSIESILRSSKINYPSGLGEAYMRLGSILIGEGKNDSAINYLTQSKNIRLASKNYSGVTGCCIMMSYAYNSLGKRELAFAQLYEALKWSEVSKDSARLANIYVSLGNLFMDYNDSKSALSQYIQSEKIATAINSAQELSLTYGGLANFYFNQEDYYKAKSYFEKKEKLDSAMGNRMALAEVTCNLGVCHYRLSQNDKAMEYYLTALAEFSKLDMLEMQALIYYNIGTIFVEKSQNDSALFYTNRALNLAKKINNTTRIAACYLLLSEIYSNQKNYKQAYEHYTQYAAVNDSILNEEKINSISEMQTKYDTEKKVQQINILNEQNKRKVAERNIFIVGTVLFLFLGLAILIGLMQTRKAKKVSEELLLNILPEEVADELKVHGKADAKYFDDVSVLFTDFKDFTQISEKLNPKELVFLLDTCFKAFDAIITRYDIEKIKTIGDSYMCAGGLPTPHSDSCKNTVLAGLEMQSFIESLSKERIERGELPIKMRLGIHTGPVVAGIVGDKKYSYDIWGDTVNTASRMESSGEIGKVNISESTYEIVKDSFNCEYRGKVKAKNKGEIDMYFVEKIND